MADANIKYRNANGELLYKKATGDGTDADPHIQGIGITSIVPGVAATSLGKAEEGTHTSGDVGIEMLAVRSDTATALAAAGKYSPLIIDGNGRLWDQSLLSAGEAHIGAVGGHTATITVSVAMTSGAGYVANDFIGTDATPLEFSGCGRANAGTGLVVSATLIDYSLQSVACELWLFDTTVTAPADSAAWSISDAHALLCIGVIPFSTYYASALNSVAPVGNLTIPFKCGAASTSLFGCLVTRGAPAYTSNFVKIRLGVAQD